MGDHTDVLRFVMVRLDRCSGGVRREENIAIVRLQFECIEGAGEPWEAANQWWEVAHTISMRPNETKLTAPPPLTSAKYELSANQYQWCE